MEQSITFCPTKAGKGFKLVVAGVWFYTSKQELFAVLNKKSGACVFRTIKEKGVSENDE